MPAIYNHPHTMRFMYPYDADKSDALVDQSATYIAIKAPELGNGSRLGRFQSIVKMRNGANVVIDRGLDTDNYETLSFMEVPDDQRTRLITFLRYVNWGSNRISVRDHNGIWKVCRVVSPNLESQELLSDKHADGTTTLKWSFSLTLLDVTNNPVEFENTDQPTEEEGVDDTMLALHLADYKHPHNPIHSCVINTPGVATSLDTVNVQEEKVNFVCWLVHVTQGVNSCYFELRMQLDSNNTGVSGGIAMAGALETMQIAGFGVVVDVSFAFDLTIGGDGNQKLSILMNSGVVGTYAKARRFKV